MLSLVKLIRHKLSGFIVNNIYIFVRYLSVLLAEIVNVIELFSLPRRPFKAFFFFFSFVP